MKRKLLLSIIPILLAICVATFSGLKVNDAFLNTIYTVAGIMFSIGMGVICTFNPERIRNNSYLKDIRADISGIRLSYIFFFGFSSILYLANQLFPIYKKCFETKFLEICFDLPITVVAVSVFGIIYYIINFLEIQKLNFQITDRINSEDA